MNHVALVGRLCADPESKVIDNKGEKKQVCNFRLAVNRPWKNTKGEYDADFLTCVAWERTAELVCKHCQKGSQLGVEGRIQVRSWETDGGDKRQAFEIQVERIHFLGSSSKGKPEAKKSEDDFPF
ncbi:MAG TPA: single-stranded DNA-binding protein [Dissulfurispiraceae bacterium]|nr:single-stranded DNA-binding protein [Dissulfurispiraceae bacterium]